jgi:hypothetical protein
MLTVKVLAPGWGSREFQRLKGAGLRGMGTVQSKGNRLVSISGQNERNRPGKLIVSATVVVHSDGKITPPSLLKAPNLPKGSAITPPSIEDVSVGGLSVYQIEQRLRMDYATANGQSPKFYSVVIDH